MGQLGFIVLIVTATRRPAGAPGPLARNDLLEHTAVVVGARSLTDRTVGLLTGQRRITVPSMQAKIMACRAAGLATARTARMRAMWELETGVLVELAVEETALTRNLLNGLAAAIAAAGLAMVARAPEPPTAARHTSY